MCQFYFEVTITYKAHSLTTVCALLLSLSLTSETTDFPNLNKGGINRGCLQACSSCWEADRKDSRVGFSDCEK